MYTAKHILTIFLFTAFCISLLTPAYLQVKQLFIQWQMQEALEKEELLQVRIKTADIVWVKQKKECLVNGELFDVKHLSSINDETVLTGLFDTKEKELKKKLEDDVKNQGSPEKSKQLVKLFSAVVNAPDEMLFTLPFFEVKYISHIGNSVYKTPYLANTAPPPKFS
jgi:hypothetical protein